MVKFRFWPKSRLLRACLLLLAVLFLPYVSSRLMSPWRRISIHSAPTPDLQTRESPRPENQIRIASYNIAHGRGTGDANWNGESRGARITRLDQIAGLLCAIDADIVVLNEVDFDPSWSQSINQARYLAENRVDVPLGHTTLAHRLDPDSPQLAVCEVQG